MNSSQDHYNVLGVAPTADPEVIRAAYRVLAQRHHPDRNTAGDGATMVRLNQAYAVLSDPQQRANFDRAQHLTHVRSQTPTTHAPRGQASAAPCAPVILTTYDHRGRLHAYA